MQSMNKKLLILEADQKLAQSFQTQLKKRNYDVGIASTIDDARLSLLEKAPDIFVIDMTSSKEPGFAEFYEFLAEQDTYASIPRIFIESPHYPSLIKKLKSRDEHFFIARPITLKQMLTVIENAQSVTVNTEGYFKLSNLINRQVGSAIIEKEIGRGGMGAVFLGYQKSLDRHVAIKVLLPKMLTDPGVLNRFRREALAIAKLKSPHIVQVYDAGLMDDRIFYIIMEYLSGETLEDLLKRKNRLSLQQSIDIIKQVASGLIVAHDANMYHRDIKPSNLIMNTSGHVVITDFGLVRRHGDIRNTKTGMIIGTPYYLSPEQASGKEIDARTDIYALGIVFYELLVGHPPFVSDNAFNVVIKHMREPIPDPRDIIGHLPDSIVTILLTMTEKNPQNRFKNCHELLASLSSERIETDIHNPQADFTKSAQSFITKASLTTFDTQFHYQLSQLQRKEHSQYVDNQLRGIATLSQSGTIQTKEGDFPEHYNDVIVIILSLVDQVKPDQNFGLWNQTVIRASDRTIVIFPRDRMIGAMLFETKDKSGSWTAISSQSNGFNESGEQNTIDPIEQILSVAGVIGAMIFDVKGQLIESRSLFDSDSEILRLRLFSVPELLNSIQISLPECDFWYEQGRVFIIKKEQIYLFIFAELNLNISLLLIIINRVFHLFATGQYQRISSQSREVAKKEVDNPLPQKVIDRFQLEFAYFIGPIARISMKKAAKKIGYSLNNFPEDKAQKLIDHLAEQLDTAKQDQFIEKALDVLHSYKSNGAI